MKTAYHFFMRHAGYSYNPSIQTPLQGRIECSKLLAKAERWALLAGYSFEWSVDPDIDSSHWSDDPVISLCWECVMRDEAGEVVQSLHGIDFGLDGSPWGDPYRRVVEAELACEEMSK